MELPRQLSVLLLLYFCGWICKRIGILDTAILRLVFLRRVNLRICACGKVPNQRGGLSEVLTQIPSPKSRSGSSKIQV